MYVQDWYIYTRGIFATSNSISHMFTFVEGLPSIDTFFILQLPVRVLSVYVYPYVPPINASTKSERPSAIERLTAHGPDLQVEFDVFCDINCLSWGQNTTASMSLVEIDSVLYWVVFICVCFFIASVMFDYYCRLQGKLSLCTFIFLNRSIKWFVYISDWYPNFWHYEVISLIWTGPQMGCYLSLECIKLCAIMFLNRSVKLFVEHQSFISKLLTLWGDKFQMKLTHMWG